MTEKTFIEKCVDGEVEDYDFEGIDDEIDKWHATKGERPLEEFLGLTPEEYAQWAQTGVLENIIKERKIKKYSHVIMVSVSGPSKSGTTTVGTLLKRALEAHKIPCEVDDSEGDYREKFFGDRIHAIQENPPLVKIKITSNK